MSGEPPVRYRPHLQRAVSASAAPYGYTLTLWTCGAVASHAHGVPSTVDALLLLCGAVVAFGLLGFGAYGTIDGVLVPGMTGRVRVWAGVHLPSVGLSVLACSLIAHLTGGHYVWPIVGFTATTMYLLLLAAQFWLTTRFRRPDDAAE